MLDALVDLGRLHNVRQQWRCLGLSSLRWGEKAPKTRSSSLSPPSSRRTGVGLVSAPELWSTRLRWRVCEVASWFEPETRRGSGQVAMVGEALFVPRPTNQARRFSWKWTVFATSRR